MAKGQDLTTGPISGHFRTLAIPMAIGMVFTTLYNVVDTFYAGMLSTDAQAGLAVSFQVFFVMVAFGFGLNSAMSALVSNAKGAKDTSGTRKLAAQGLSFGVIVTVIFMVVALWLGPKLIEIVSEPGGYRDAGTGYFHWLIVALPGFMLAYGGNGILQAHGDSRSLQRALMGAFFANVILNPLLMFGIPGVWDGMGFNGIALATVISQTGVMIFILLQVMKSDIMADAQELVFAPRAKWIWEITQQAIPTAFTMMVMMIAGFVVQYFLKEFNGSAVAAYGIGLRVEQLILLPGFGLTGALLPIVAQNYGAQNFDRVREAVAFCCKAGVALMFAGSLVLWVAAPYLMAIFSADPEVIRIGAQYLRVDGFILPVYIVLFAMNSFLQALQKPIWTLWIGIFRQGIGVLLFIWLFVRVFEMGTLGVWLGIAVSVTLGLIMSLIVSAWVARDKIGGIRA